MYVSFYIEQKFHPEQYGALAQLLAKQYFVTGTVASVVCTVVRGVAMPLLLFAAL